MPAKAAKAPARAKRSRAEVQREFEEVQEQVEQARESADPKSEEAGRQRESEVRAAVENVTVESVVQRLSGLGLEVNKALSGIAAKLTEEVQLLGSVREAVALEREEIEHLHKIDVAATALDQLVADYARE
jgi:F0F1-type ATP synthase membrane subunit b/b'